MTVTDLQPGSIVGIAGPVIDAEFPPGELPEINTALEFDVELDGVETTIVAEVAQQIGENLPEKEQRSVIMTADADDRVALVSQLPSLALKTAFSSKQML